MRKAIGNAEELVQETFTQAAADGNDGNVKEFKELKSKLAGIKAQHEVFDNNIEGVVRLLKENRGQEAAQIAPKVQQEFGKLTEEVSSFLEGINEFTTQSANTAEALEKFSIILLLIISVVSAVISLGVSLRVMRASVSRPLAEVVAALNKLAEGDAAADCVVHSDDEIGQVEKAFQTFKERTLKMRRMEVEKAESEKRAEDERREREASEELRQREEEQRMQQERRQAPLKLADDLEQRMKGVVDGVSAAATEMEASAQSVSASAEETSNQAAIVAAASEEASSNVQTVAAAAE